MEFCLCREIWASMKSLKNIFFIRFNVFNISPTGDKKNPSKARDHFCLTLRYTLMLTYIWSEMVRNVTSLNLFCSNVP